MAAQTGLTIVKKFPYRGDPNEEFSNTYHFTGSVPADSTAWAALAAALAAEEKAVYSADVSIIRYYGYATDNPADAAVWSSDISGAPIAGTLTPTGGAQMAGDCAVWVRWKTSRLNSKGKAIYLRKYFHDVFATISGSNADTVLAAQKTQLDELGTDLMDGTFLDGRTITARGHTDTITARASSTYVTTRTLKRRGKRPGS